MTPPGSTSQISRIVVDDCADDRRVEKIIIQEAGIPGPAGASDSLGSVSFAEPLEYDPASRTISIAPPPAPGQAYQWNGSEWAAVRIAERRVEHRVVTLSEQFAKELLLEHPISDPSKIAFDIYGGGGPQFLDVDYFVVGDRIIRWDGTPLDGVLVAGDRVRLVYE